MIKLIPVIDILSGRVVRGIAGQRDQYQPNHSKLVDGSDPVETAQEFIELFNVDTIYIADLDALTDNGSSAAIIKEISELGVQTVVDAAATTPAEIAEMADLGVDQVVIPLEAMTSLNLLEELLSSTDVDRLVFSLDLKSGAVLGPLAEKMTPLQVVEEVYRSGIRKLIVLDLAGVGVSAGVPTVQLCQHIKASHSEFEIWTGGGVRTIDDVSELNDAGFNGVLVASALHDGKVTPETWSSYSSDS